MMTFLAIKPRPAAPTRPMIAVLALNIAPTKPDNVDLADLIPFRNRFVFAVSETDNLLIVAMWENRS